MLNLNDRPVQITLRIFACNIVIHKWAPALIAFLICWGFGSGDAVSAATKVKLSEKEKIRWVEQGVAAYEVGQRAEAKRRLEKVRTSFADNYAIPYYLGAIYLAEGNRDAAISEWQRYATLDTHSENSLKIQKYVTLLRCEQARDRARKAVAEAATSVVGAAAGHAIAVPSFKNTGYEVFGPLGKGLASLLISDLSQVPDLAVLDRIQVEVMVRAASDDASGQIDPNSAVDMGALLEVNHMIAGRLKKVKKDQLQIESTVFDASQLTGGDTMTIEGDMAQFYSMEKDLACKIVKRLGKDCKKMPDGFHAIHTRSLAALVLYSWGLDYFDREEYDHARERFQKALAKDPQFELAAKALATTPTSAMGAKSISQLINSVASNGISSSAAGNAVAGYNGTSKTKFIIGGLALVGGGAALVGGGGGGSSSPPASPPSPSLTGVWLCGMNNGATFKLDLNQENSKVQGVLNNSDWDCMTTGIVTGTVQGDQINLDIASDSNSTVITLNGRFNDTIKISGDWGTGAADTPCNSGSGSFNGEKAATGEIEW